MAIAIGACGRDDARLRADVSRYIQATADWAPVEAESARAVERIFATQFVDEAEVRREITELRPRVDRHIAVVRTYVATTPTLRTIHRAYIDAWNALAEGCDLIRSGLERDDPTHLAIGRERLAEWVAGLRQVAAELRTLADRLDTPISPPRVH